MPKWRWWRLCHILITAYIVTSLASFCYIYRNWEQLFSIPGLNASMKPVEIYRAPRDLSVKLDDSKVECEKMPHKVKLQIMGPALNPTYMSVNRPTDNSEESESESGQQSDDGHAIRHKKQRPFHVPAGYIKVLHDEPVSSMTVIDNTVANDNVEFSFDGINIVKSHVVKPEVTTKRLENVDKSEKQMPRLYNTTVGRFIQLVKPRSRRSGRTYGFWECQSIVKWVDLGHDHFPRFLRTVVCTQEKCVYGFYNCKPKNFKVKILRRRVDSCVAPFEDRSSISRDANAFIPVELREKWVVEDKEVTFCCYCVKP